MAKRKISEFAEVLTGGTPNTNISAYWNGDIPWLPSGVCQDCEVTKADTYITNEGLENSAAKLMPPETVLIALTGATTGKTGLLKFKACANQSVTGILPNSSFVPKYLFYYLQSCRNKILSDSYGGAQKHISQAYVKDIRVDLPDLKIQKKLANTLDSIVDLISMRNQQLVALDELVKSRFMELFGNPEINDRCWDEHKLSEELSVLGGYAFKSDLFQEEGIPVLRIGNINSGTFRSVNMVYWQQDEGLSRYMIYPGDLVMSLTGTVGKDDYGNVCILGSEYEVYYLNQRNAKLELKDNLDKYYLAELLKFPQIKKRLTGISRGIRQANISNKDILELVVPIPPIKLQQQFAAFVAQVDKSKHFSELEVAA